MPAGTHPAVLWGAVLGAEMPDIDFVVRFAGGRIRYLKEHRGPTHGLVILPIEAALVAGVLHLIWPAAPFLSIFLWAWLGALSHVLSDFGNDYGTRGLWPFSNRKIALDIIPIVDLGLLGLTSGGWLLTAIWPASRRAIFIGVWVLVALYVLLRIGLRMRARQLVAERYDVVGRCKGAAPCGVGWRDERLVVHPTMLSLRAWHYIVQMPDHFLVGLVWVDRGKVGQPRQISNHPMEPPVEASLRSVVIATFAHWVRRPRVTAEQKNGLYFVRWTDIRYDMDEYSPFSAYAWLDQNLTVVEDGLGSQTLPALEKEVLRRRLRQEMGVEEP